MNENDDFLEPFNFDEEKLADKSIPESKYTSNKISGLNSKSTDNTSQSKGNPNVRTVYNPYTKGYYNPADITDPNHPENYNNTQSVAKFDVNAFAEYAKEQQRKDDIEKYYATGGTNVEDGLTSTKTLNEDYDGAYLDQFNIGKSSDVDPNMKEKVRLGIVDRSEEN
jgi:hypothetical protein